MSDDDNVHQEGSSLVERFVFIDRFSDDDLEADVPPPWPRFNRWPSDPPGWSAMYESGGSAECAAFDDVADAIAWGRERCDLVIVRLGTVPETWYSAGAVRAHERSDSTGNPFLEWPPDRWPNYEGPDGETRTFKRSSLGF
jgi:hypothetical protein